MGKKRKGVKQRTIQAQLNVVKEQSPSGMGLALNMISNKGYDNFQVARELRNKGYSNERIHEIIRALNK